MPKSINLFVLSIALLFPIVGYSQSFLLGLATGAAVSGSDESAPRSLGANTIYTADQKVLKGVNWENIEMAGITKCFKDPSDKDSRIKERFSGTRKSISILFQQVIRSYNLKNPTLLQIQRVFLGDNDKCIKFWFTYVENN